MDFALISIGAAVILAVAIILALMLALAEKLFKVEEDPRLEAINGLLPQINCGGCGFPGCRGLAEALTTGSQQEVNCRPIKQENKEKILEILKG